MGYKKNQAKLKPLVWHKNGNSIIVNTGHKAFDNQCQLFSTGNTSSNTQYSGFIRHWNDRMEDMENYNPSPGHLFEFDMNIFITEFRIPQYIVNQIAKKARERNDSMILYCFKHMNNKGKRIIHGYVLTDVNYKFIEQWITGPTYKSYAIINECKKYISYKI